jgi:hypothetical protein
MFTMAARCDDAEIGTARAGSCSPLGLVLAGIGIAAGAAAQGAPPSSYLFKFLHIHQRAYALKLGADLIGIGMARASRAGERLQPGLPGLRQLAGDVANVGDVGEGTVSSYRSLRRRRTGGLRLCAGRSRARLGGA